MRASEAYYERDEADHGHRVLEIYQLTPLKNLKELLFNYTYKVWMHCDVENALLQDYSQFPGLFCGKKSMLH